MRARDLERLASTEYDLLVVGGGIHGLAIAYEAASRGVRTALVEAHDFGSGASFNHQKTAHGGLRSLQSGDIGRAREAIRERRALARIAPWFLRPLPFIVGTYRSVIKNRVAMRLALRFDEWLGRHRNAGVEPELHLPAPRLVSKPATLRLFPGVRPDGLTGGAQWYDYQMVEADRLTVAFAEAADRAGADLANHCEAVAAIRTPDLKVGPTGTDRKVGPTGTDRKVGPTIAGMVVRDSLTGRTLEVRAKLTLNAAGSHAGVVMGMFGVTRPFPLVKAMNLVTSKPASDIALAAPSSTGRMFTLTPWRGRAMVGTYQTDTLVQPADSAVTAAEVDAFIAQANEAFPALTLTRADVTLVHRGIVPAVVKNGRPELKPHPDIIDHAAEGAPGAMTVVGVKYTTARGVAERVVTRIATRLGPRVAPSRTDTTVLPGAGIADHEALTIETARDVHLDLPPSAIQHLIRLYAENAATIVRLMAAQPDLATLLPGTDRPLAEIVHVIRHEMAMRLADIVIRRTALGSAGHPGDAVVAECAALAARELGWDPARTAGEIAAVNGFYEIK